MAKFEFFDFGRVEWFQLARPNIILLFVLGTSEIVYSAQVGKAKYVYCPKGQLQLNLTNDFKDSSQLLNVTNHITQVFPVVGEPMQTPQGIAISVRVYGSNYWILQPQAGNSFCSFCLKADCTDRIPRLVLEKLDAVVRPDPNANKNADCDPLAPVPTPQMPPTQEAPSKVATVPPATALPASPPAQSAKPAPAPPVTAQQSPVTPPVTSTADRSSEEKGSGQSSRVSPQAASQPVKSEQAPSASTSTTSPNAPASDASSSAVEIMSKLHAMGFDCGSPGLGSGVTSKAGATFTSSAANGIRCRGSFKSYTQSSYKTNSRDRKDLVNILIPWNYQPQAKPNLQLHLTGHNAGAPPEIHFGANDLSSILNKNNSSTIMIVPESDGEVKNYADKFTVNDPKRNAIIPFFNEIRSILGSAGLLGADATSSLSGELGPLTISAHSGGGRFIPEIVKGLQSLPDRPRIATVMAIDSIYGDNQRAAMADTIRNLRKTDQTQFVLPYENVKREPKYDTSAYYDSLLKTLGPEVRLSPLADSPNSTVDLSCLPVCIVPTKQGHDKQVRPVLESVLRRRPN